MKAKFYEINQNNSGGSFITDDKLCHRLFIEADSADEAAEIAENHGCYWNGVENGEDCPCCGDRWHVPYSEEGINLDEINTKWKGYEVYEYINEKQYKESAIKEFKSRYKGMFWVEEPKVEKAYSGYKIVGRVRLDTIEQYAQMLANLYGWTTPDCRIFYKDGTVKEIFSIKPKLKSK